MEKTQKIKVTCIHSKFFIWDAEDAMNLRINWRITGSLVGPSPGLPYQNGQLGLPLELSIMEAKFLLVKDAIELFEVDRERNPSESTLKNYELYKTETFLDYERQVKEERKQHILSNAESIVQVGRKRQNLNMDTDDKQIIDEKLNHITVQADQMLVHVFTKCPWQEHLIPLPMSTLSRQELLKYKVFKDLWDKGHYVSNGLKFSCDFLVYEGDPMQYHAKYMVVCKDIDEDLRALELQIRGRLSVQVNKDIMIASIETNDGGDEIVVYMMFKWKGRKRANPVSLPNTS